ncbi:MAG: Mov34/MPN/PAD-1 family protein [Acutalibacteraceae bacterium]
MKISKQAYNQLVFDSELAPPEIGGVLGGVNGCIRQVVFINGFSDKNLACYMPDVSKMNALIDKWSCNSIDFYGIFHTHPYCCTRLSNEDRRYIKEIMLAMPTDIKKLYFPIVIPKTKIIAVKAVKRSGETKILYEKTFIRR